MQERVATAHQATGDSMKVGGAVGLVGLLGALALWLMGDAFPVVSLAGELRAGPLAQPGPAWLALGVTIGAAVGLAVAVSGPGTRDRPPR